MSTPSRRERLLAVLACLAVAAAYILLAYVHGALGASRNDDWTYYRIAFELDETGALAPDPYTKAFVVGLVLAAQPVIALFGQSITALQVLVTVIGAVGLYAAYRVVRDFLPAGWAAFSVACLALGPLYGALSTSFMTDVPGFTMQALAVWLGLRALRAQPHALVWLALSLAVSLAGFTVWEHSTASAVAVVLAFLLVRWDEGSRARLVAAGLGLTWVLAAGALFSWRSGLPSVAGGSLAPPGTLVDSARMASRIGYTLAALTLPAAALWWLRRWSRGELAALAAGLLLAVPLGLKWRGNILLGNYLTPYASYPETLFGSPPRTSPESAWLLLIGFVVVAAATVVAVALRALAARRQQVGKVIRSQPGVVLVTVFAVTSVLVAVGASAASGAWIVDRYLIAAVPFLAAVLIWTVRGTAARPAPYAAAGVLAVWAVIGLHQADVSATLDGAKHRMGTQLATQGYSPSTIDAGLEWFGPHQQSRVTAPKPEPDHYAFWLGLIEEPRVCVLARFPLDESADAERPVIVATLTARSLLGVRYDLVAHEVDLNCSVT